MLESQYGVWFGSQTTARTGAASKPQGGTALANFPSRANVRYSGSHQMPNARRSSSGCTASHTPKVTVNPPLSATGKSARMKAPTPGTCIITDLFGSS